MNILLLCPHLIAGNKTSEEFVIRRIRVRGGHVSIQIRILDFASWILSMAELRATVRIPGPALYECISCASNNNTILHLIQIYFLRNFSYQVADSITKFTSHGWKNNNSSFFFNQVR